MGYTDKDIPYSVKSVSLATDRSAAYVIDGDSLEKIANTLTVITLDGGDLTFKLNSTDNDAITASDGLIIQGVVITEIYYSNAAQPALTAEIFLAWVD